MSPNTDVALAVGPTISGPLFNMTGFFLNLS